MFELISAFTQVADVLLTKNQHFSIHALVQDKKNDYCKVKCKLIRSEVLGEAAAPAEDLGDEDQALERLQGHAAAGELENGAWVQDFTLLAAAAGGPRADPAAQQAAIEEMRQTLESVAACLAKE